MSHLPLIALPLDQPDGRVLTTALTTGQALIIDVERTLTTSVCRRCGRTISAFHGDDQPLTLRHLPIFGYVVSSRIRPQRLRCP